MQYRQPTQSEAFALLANPAELLNSITHGIGLALSLAATVPLLVLAGRHGETEQILGCAVYAMTLVLVYAASTLSHVVQEPRRKRLFRVLDQGFIYLLIAGTYTPFALAYLHSGWWWVLSAMMWSVALLGFFSKVLFAHRVERVSIVLYVLLGWLPAIGVWHTVQLIPVWGLGWMLIGGLFYTVGTVFLLLDEKAVHFHAIWHVFVIGGSACHYYAILLYVVLYNS